MLTGTDIEFKRRLQKFIEEEFKDKMERLAFNDPKEMLDERRGYIRCLRAVGLKCDEIDREMQGS